MALLRTIPVYITVVTILATQLSLSTNNLPSPQNVIELYKKCGIQLLRLFDPSPDVLEALRGSNLQVSLGTTDADVPVLASSPEAASQWVNTNVAPYKNDVNFQWIVLGNEILPGPQAGFIAQAIQNIRNAINAIGLTNTQVTTSIEMPALGTSYPPSAGAFTSDVAAVMPNIASFLAQTGSPLMLNAYPYYAYTQNTAQISLEYATFQSTSPVVVDGGLQYFNLFDAMVDSVYAALEKVGGASVPIVIGETGWPTEGNDPYSSIQNAQTFNQNLLKYVQAAKGTPKRPGQTFDIFLFAMFNEDLKQSGIEQHWGIFYPNGTAIYPLLQC